MADCAAGNPAYSDFWHFEPKPGFFGSSADTCAPGSRRRPAKPAKGRRSIIQQLGKGFSTEARIALKTKTRDAGPTTVLRTSVSHCMPATVWHVTHGDPVTWLQLGLGKLRLLEWKSAEVSRPCLLSPAVLPRQL